jgi:hypothetical protein
LWQQTSLQIKYDPVPYNHTLYINPKSREPILAIDGMLIEIRKPSHAPSLPVTGQCAHSHIPNMTFKRSFTKAANIYINQQT